MCVGGCVCVCVCDVYVYLVKCVFVSVVRVCVVMSV